MAKHKQGKWWFLLGLAAIVAVGLSLHWVTNGQNHDEETITIGSLGADVKVWQHIAASPAAKEAGLKIKVKSFTDPVQLNRGTAGGEIDVNAFQSWAYLQNFNHESKQKLAALGTTYLEPMGIYSKKYHRVKDLPDGTTITLANNPANTARGLKLLASAGLLTLKKSFGPTSGTNEIATNPHHFKFEEIDDTTGPRVLNSVDAVLIGNTIALEGHLNVLKDSIYHEKVDQSTKDNVNVLATAKANAHKAAYRKLVKLYHETKIQKWIADQYQGTKVEVDKPLSYLTK